MRDTVLVQIGEKISDILDRYGTDTDKFPLDRDEALFEENVEAARRFMKKVKDSILNEESNTSMPEPADGETVTKTTVSKSKDGGESALEKAVEAAGGFGDGDGDEGEGEGGDEDIVDMSDEGAGNLLKVLQSKF